MLSLQLAKEFITPSIKTYFPIFYLPIPSFLLKRVTSILIKLRRWAFLLTFIPERFFPNFFSQRQFPYYFPNLLKPRLIKIRIGFHLLLWFQLTTGKWTNTKIFYQFKAKIALNLGDIKEESKTQILPESLERLFEWATILSNC